MKRQSYPIHNSFPLEKLLSFLSKQDDFLLLNNSFNSTNPTFQFKVGIGCLKNVSTYQTSINDFIKEASLQSQTVFSHLTYGLKNQFEKLSDKHADVFSWPQVNFFIAQQEITITEKEITIQCNDNSNSDDIYKLLIESNDDWKENETEVRCNPSLNRETYISKINSILQHIQRGDIYEMNFCFPFEGNGSINPFAIYKELCSKSPAPFSAFYKCKDNYLLCSSPERFIKREGSKISSQPIKGTAKRGSTVVEDEQLKSDLFNSEKERSENVMIVDLVRNDLSRIATKGSVKVDELFGIYTFPAVHQMISTISCDVDAELKFTDILRALFPMGSMTGAPKIRAMEIINETENFNRGLYSGSIGYILPNGDFDFNVVIRSILYNSSSQSISIPVGSAITASCDPQLEYDECLLKAKALLELLQSTKTATVK